MRKCIDEGTLQAWFDGELDANAAADVTAHLHSCIHCGEAARTLEVENLILSQGLSAEFVEAVPTERLRQRVQSAAASGLQVTNGADHQWFVGQCHSQFVAVVSSGGLRVQSPPQF